MSLLSDLSSVMSTIEQTLERLDECAKEAVGGPQDDTVQDLYEVERHLKAGQRRLKRALDYLEQV